MVIRSLGHWVIGGLVFGGFFVGEVDGSYDEAEKGYSDGIPEAGKVIGAGQSGDECGDEGNKAAEDTVSNVVG